MNCDNDPLTYIIQIETVGRIWQTLTPNQLAVAALRWDGLTDVIIAELLGIRRGTVYQRMQNAREKLVREMPELAPLIEGRHFRRKIGGNQRIRSLECRQ